MHSDKLHTNKLLIVLFLLVIVSPTLVSIFNLEGSSSNTENRTKTTFPNIKTLKNPKAFIKQLKKYYTDDFGLKNTLSNSYIHIKHRKLNETPLPSKVVIGKNGFLFLGNSVNNVVNKSLGFVLFTKSELATIKAKIIERKQWLEARNIAFYVAVAPNKHSVYRENLPFTFPETTTQKEQLITYLQKEINFNLLDLGEQFPQKKQQNRLYHKLDSHWDNLGAFYAYQTLIDEIQKDFPSIQKKTLAEYKLDTIFRIGDIGTMINYTKKDTIVTLQLKQPIEIDTIKKAQHNPIKIATSFFKNNTKKQKILVFRDSFGTALKQYLNQTFGECTYIWSYKFDKEIIRKEKPDIVIMQYVERNLDQLKK